MLHSVIFQTDAYDWDAIRTMFGHVDEGGRLTGISTNERGVRVHFVNEPISEDIDLLVSIFQLPPIEIIQE